MRDLIRTCRITRYLRRRCARSRASRTLISANKEMRLYLSRDELPTDKTGMMGNSDSRGPGMSTGRGILRNVCIGSWTLYDFSSQSEHYTANGKERGC